MRLGQACDVLDDVVHDVLVLSGGDELWLVVLVVVVVGEPYVAELVETCWELLDETEVE